VTATTLNHQYQSKPVSGPLSHTEIGQDIQI